MQTKGLMALIQEYDQQQQMEIARLKQQIMELNDRINKLTDLAVKSAQVREKATLELIMAGALRKPDKLCYYEDCTQDNPVTSDLSKITCPACRDVMGLPAIHEPKQ